jgi:syntaxin-binding protein 5
MTWHRNPTAAIQFHDISAQLLITSDATPIENHFPKPLPRLTIDLRTLLTDSAVVKKTSPSFLERARVEWAYLARQSLECAVQFASGEIVVYRLKSSSASLPKFTEMSDDELVPLEHVLSSDDARFSPYFLLTTGKPVTACAISDVGESRRDELFAQALNSTLPGFLAVAYNAYLIVVDMRGPRVMLRHGRDKKKDRMSLHASDSVNTITLLTWAVATIDKGTPIFDPALTRIHCWPYRSAASFSFDRGLQLWRDGSLYGPSRHKFPCLANRWRYQESGDCCESLARRSLPTGLEEWTSHSGN